MSSKVTAEYPMRVLYHNDGLLDTKEVLYVIVIFEGVRSRAIVVCHLDLDGGN
jgi:hypothetical protein